VIERAIHIERSGPVAWVWLSRPEVHNAFNAALIAELTDAFAALKDDMGVRAIVLAGRGRSFSAGADVHWMRQQGGAPIEENTADARRLAMMFHAIAESPKPTVARVHGAAIGGGIGLVAACDIAIGATGAVFAASEVRLGLIAATIAPYVIRAIGARHARRLFLTGERIDSSAAEKIGLLHEAVPEEQLDDRVRAITESILAGAPLAQKATKALISAVADQPITARLIEDTSERIALCRAGSEAAEGLSAFLEKRPAAWIP
jgi:methylglutaconyl-CoA hydratase